MSWLNDFRFGPMSRIVFGVGKAREAGSIARELEGAECCLAAVRRLRAACEVEEPLRSHGMSEEAVQTCAERVFAQHAPRSTGGPRAFRSLDEVLSLLKRAY